MSPYDADDLTVVIARRGDKFIVLRSPDTAEDGPKYEEVGVFATLELAGTCLSEAED
jgi:hypothetical protein